MRVTIEISPDATDREIIVAVRAAMRVPPPGTDPAVALAYYNFTRTKIILPVTGHEVDVPLPGDLIISYFQRVATQVGSTVDKTGGFFQNADYWAIGRMADRALNLAVQADAFANAEAYGLGGPGAPGVAAGPYTGTGGLEPKPEAIGGPPIYIGELAANSVNSPYHASNPQQVQYALATEDGLYSAYCKNSVPVFVGVGFPPGVATYDDLKAGGAWGSQQAEVAVKAGQHFCFVHEGNAGDEMHASGRKV